MNREKKQSEIDYPFLFSTLTIGPHRIENRIVALPVHTGFACPDGRVSSWMIDFYAKLARSGAGMVVVANTAVSVDGVVSNFNLRADKDELIPSLADLATAIKRNGAIACLQLNHAGRFAKTAIPLLPSPMNHANLSFNMESLKNFMEFFPFEKRFGLTREFLRQIKTWRRAMDDCERERVIDDFSQAALRAFQAGFDMVELHGANGYLLCQYLSSFTNKLESGFGGDFNARAAFPLAVIQAVKQLLPRDFPLGFRILLREGVPGGIELPEALAFAKLLEQAGIAYLSASMGTFNSIFSTDTIKEMAKTAYLRKDMGVLSGSVDIPTIISGRITTPSVAEKIIKDGVADLVGLGRPLRCDLGWVKKAKENSGKIRVCINCNWCLKRVIQEEGFCCSRWPKLLRDKTDLEHKLLTRSDKTLWLIAGTRDMQTFKQSLPLLAGNARHSPCPAILFLKAETDESFFDAAKADFIRWAEDAFKSSGISCALSGNVFEASGAAWQNTIHRIVKQGDFGRIFLCSDRKQSWRRGMLYKENGKAVALLGANSRQERIIAPVDLSDASLLQMVFLGNGYMKAGGFSVDFVHVPTGKTETAEQRWRQLKSIAGLRRNIPLRFVAPETDVASALAEIIHSGGYGTVVMGKRGLSGLKRWLLGSVSSGVLKRLTDQSLFLID